MEIEHISYCQRNKEEVVQLCKHVLLVQAGQIKSINLEQGKIIGTFSCGLDPNSLKIKMRLSALKENGWQIIISAHFMNTVDLHNKAYNTLKETVRLIELSSVRPSKKIKNVSICIDFKSIVAYIRQSNILPWIIIILIVLVISIISVGLSSVLIPFIWNSI